MASELPIPPVPPDRAVEALRGASEATERVRRFVARAGRVHVPVLLEGETGTGKTHLARLIHEASQRAAGPFVTVNCAGIPDTLFESEFFGHRKGAFTGASESRPGLFEQASGGTLVLDEIGELPLSQQAKLLTVLEDGSIRPLGAVRSRRVDVRVVAATCRDLTRTLRQGAFRPDLYHRLALLRWRLEPLRARPADLEPLAGHFLHRHGIKHGAGAPELTPAALALLQGHPWPGNVRELSHVLEAALILAGTRILDQGHVRAVLDTTVDSPWGPPAADAGTVVRGEGEASSNAGRYSFFGSEEEERAAIRSALERWRGNRTRTARALGMARNTLRAKMRKYGL